MLSAILYDILHEKMKKSKVKEKAEFIKKFKAKLKLNIK